MEHLNKGQMPEIIPPKILSNSIDYYKQTQQESNRDIKDNDNNIFVMCKI